MTIIGSCGHEINDISLCDVRIMSFTRDCERCVSYHCACEECKKEWKKDGVVLETEEECQKWLDGELEYPENF